MILGGQHVEVGHRWEGFGAHEAGRHRVEVAPAVDGQGVEDVAELHRVAAQLVPVERRVVLEGLAVVGRDGHVHLAEGAAQLVVGKGGEVLVLGGGREHHVELAGAVDHGLGDQGAPGDVGGDVGLDGRVGDERPARVGEGVGAPVVGAEGQGLGRRELVVGEVDDTLLVRGQPRTVVGRARLTHDHPPAVPWVGEGPDGVERGPVVVAEADGRSHRLQVGQVHPSRVGGHDLVGVASSDVGAGEPGLVGVGEAGAVVVGGPHGHPGSAVEDRRDALGAVDVDVVLLVGGDPGLAAPGADQLDGLGEGRGRRLPRQRRHREQGRARSHDQRHAQSTVHGHLTGSGSSQGAPALR